MKLADTHYDNHLTGCCAPVDREHWDRKVHHWKDQRFLKDHVHEILHVPLDYAKVIGRDMARIEAASAWPEHPVTLSDEVSAWGADLYTAIDREIPGVDMAIMSGDFYTRVFEGPYGDAGRWVPEMQRWVEQQGAKVAHMYFYWATCPNCAKKLGKNEVVLVARAAEA